MRSARILAALLIASPFAALLVTPAGAQAESSWTLEIVSGLGTGLAEIGGQGSIAMDSLGEDVYIAYTRDDNDHAGLVRRNASSGQWVVINADFGLGATSFEPRGVAICSATNIAVLGTEDSTSTRVYNSTDGGLTWTSTLVVGGTTTGARLEQHTTTLANLMVYRVDTGSVRVYHSYDCGATWTTNFSITDCAGAPSGTCGTSLSTTTLKAQFYGYAILGHGSAPPSCKEATEVDSADRFWTVPFKSEGSGVVGRGVFDPNDPGCAVFSYRGRETLFWTAAGGASAGTTFAGYTYQTSFTANYATGDPTTPYNPAGKVVTTCTHTITSTSKPEHRTHSLDGKAIMAVACTDVSRLRIYYRTAPNSEWFLSHEQSYTTEPAIGAIITGTKSYVAYTNTAVANRLQVLVADNPAAVATVTSGASATIPAGFSLTGFDVDPWNGATIARLRETGVQDVIQAYDPQSLATVGDSVAQPTCNLGRGVLAHWEPLPGRAYTGFLNCAAGGNTDRLSIRSATLGDPLQSGTICEGDDFCDFDLSTDDTAALGEPCPGGQTTDTFPPNAAFVANLANLPISWQNGVSTPSTILGNPDYALLGFAYINNAGSSAAGGGNIGVWLIKQKNNNEDSTCGQEVQFASPGDARHICTWAYKQQTFIAAAGQNAPLAVWKVTVEPDSDGFKAPRMGIQRMITLTDPPYNNLHGVGCGSGRDVTILTSTGTIERIQVLNEAGTGGSFAKKWTATDGSATVSGIATSQDNNWTAYVSGTNVAVVNASTGIRVAQFAIPTGTFRDLRLDDTGQRLWVATSQRIEWASIWEATTLTPVPPGIRNPGTPEECQITTYGDCTDELGANPPGVTRSPGLPGVDSEAFSVAMGITTEAGGWVLGLIFIFGLTAGMYFVKPVLAVVGALLGIGMSVAMDLIPLWFLLVLILLGAAVLVLKFRGGVSA